MGIIFGSGTPLYVIRGDAGRNCGAVRDARNHIALSEIENSFTGKTKALKSIYVLYLPIRNRTLQASRQPMPDPPQGFKVCHCLQDIRFAPEVARVWQASI